MTDAQTVVTRPRPLPHQLHVVAVTELTTSYRRVRFVAPTLIGVDTGDASTIELLFPNPPAPTCPLVRPFTLLDLDVITGEFDVDFVLHDQGGVAADWVMRARSGDTLRMFGPRGGGMLANGAQRLVLVGDATAVPAISALVKAARPEACIDVLLKVPCHGDVLPLSSRAALNTQWLVSDSNDPRQLLTAVRALPVETSEVDFWWVACEKYSAVDIDLHLREARGVDTNCVKVIPYWKAGSSEELFRDERHRLTNGVKP